MRKVYKVMICENNSKPKVYSIYDNRLLASNAMKYLDKKGYFTYISIEVEELPKPKLYVVPKLNSYNNLFFKGI